MAATKKSSARKAPAKKAKKTTASGKPEKKRIRKASATRAAPAQKKHVELTRADKMQQAAVDALEDAKGQEIVTLDVHKRTDITDRMIVASGTSTRHVASMADRVVEKMKAAGYRPLGTEGKGAGEWVLIDFGDVVVHVMHPQTRNFYNLEKLWSVDFAEEESGQQSELEQHIRSRRARK